MPGAYLHPQAIQVWSTKWRLRSRLPGRKPVRISSFVPARVDAGLALSQESTTTKGHVDRSTHNRTQSNNDNITILRQRISTWLVDDILELF
jgi:hypothetical protein